MKIDERRPGRQCGGLENLAEPEAQDIADLPDIEASGELLGIDGVDLLDRRTIAVRGDSQRTGTGGPLLNPIPRAPRALRPLVVQACDGETPQSGENRWKGPTGFWGGQDDHFRSPPIQHLISLLAVGKSLPDQASQLRPLATVDSRDDE